MSHINPKVQLTNKKAGQITTIKIRKDTTIRKKNTFQPPVTQKPWVNAKFGLPTGLPNWTIPTMPQHPAYWNQFPQPQWHPQNQFGY